MATNSKDPALFKKPNSSSNIDTLPSKTFFVDVVGIGVDKTRGYEGVGKSSLINRIAKNEFIQENNSPDGISAKTPTATLILRDNSAADQYERRMHAIRQMDVVLLCYDITDKESFEYINKHFHNISQNLNYQHASFILVATKGDTEMERAVSEEAKFFAQDRNIGYIETSAKTGMGIEALTNAIAPSPQELSENKSEVQQEKRSCLVM